MPGKKGNRRVPPKVREPLKKDLLASEISSGAIKFFRGITREYDGNVAKGKLTREEATHGQIGEMNVFIARRLPITPEKRSEAIRLLTEDGRAVLLCVKAVHGIPYSKAEFIERIDRAVKLIPFIREELIREVPHGKQIIEGLVGVKEKLLADPRQEVHGGARILTDISRINILQLRKIIGEETFLLFHKIQSNCVNEIVK